MNAREAGELAARIDVYWPHARVQVNEELQHQAWADAMHDITLDEAVHAVLTITRRGDLFPPPVSVIVRTVREQRAELDGTAAPSPDEALRVVMDAVRRFGFVGFSEAVEDGFRWPHPAISAAVDAIGWRELCLTENPSTTRAQFLRMYESARDRHTRMATSDDVRALTAGRLTPELPEG